jgi:hypothetical protein
MLLLFGKFTGTSKYRRNLPQVLCQIAGQLFGWAGTSTVFWV